MFPAPAWTDGRRRDSVPVPSTAIDAASIQMNSGGLSSAIEPSIHGLGRIHCRQPWSAFRAAAGKIAPPTGSADSLHSRRPSPRAVAASSTAAAAPRLEVVGGGEGGDGLMGGSGGRGGGE